MSMERNLGTWWRTSSLSREMWGYRWRSIWKTGSEAIKKTGEKVEKIYKAASIKTKNFVKLTQKIETLLVMKREKQKVESVDSRSGNVRYQGKHRKKSKNGKYKKKLGDVLDTLFDVKTEKFL